MSDSRLPAILYLVMLAMGLLNWAHVYPQLPAVMASHFSARGEANGWAPKSAFFGIMVFCVCLSAFVGFIVPRTIASRPPEKLNLPNKDYWLAPEHRNETWRFIRAQMVWFACALLFVFLFGTSQAINANLPAAGSFNSQAMLAVMVGFGLFCVLWIAIFLRHFYNVPPSPHSSGPLRSS
jgi:uncharacterized membrane protein